MDLASALELPGQDVTLSNSGSYMGYPLPEPFRYGRLPEPTTHVRLFRFVDIPDTQNGARTADIAGGCTAMVSGLSGRVIMRHETGTDLSDPWYTTPNGGELGNAQYDALGNKSASRFALRPYEHGFDEYLSPKPIMENDVIGTLETWRRDVAPPYIAISYTWGSGSAMVPIELNGRSFKVPRNCVEALCKVKQHLKRNICHLWIDAICIDQENFEEKGHQVQTMGTIFAEAVFVYAYVQSVYGTHRELLRCFETMEKMKLETRNKNRSRSVQQRDNDREFYRNYLSSREKEKSLGDLAVAMLGFAWEKY